MANTKTRKLTIVRTSTQPLRLEQGEAVHVGVDVHKSSYSVALYSDSRGVLTTWVQPARPEVLLERLRPVQSCIAQVVYEAGPTGFGLARLLRAEGYKAQVIAPSKLLAPVGPEAKSDRLDCRRLAQLSAKGLLHPVRVPTEQEEADRQVLRLREQLVRKTRSVQAQIKKLLAPAWDRRTGRPSVSAHNSCNEFGGPPMLTIGSDSMGGPPDAGATTGEIDDRSTGCGCFACRRP